MLYFIIDYCKKHGIVLVPGIPHPVRSGFAQNRLTKEEVDAFLKLCYNLMEHFCFFGKSTNVLKEREEKEENATASNPSQVVHDPLTQVQEATLLYEAIKLRCTTVQLFILACLDGSTCRCQ